MPITMDTEELPFLRRLSRKSFTEGEARGRAEGEARGMSKLLRDQLEIKFGRVPRWADSRMSKATPAQLGRWARKVLAAETVEGVIGPRHRNGS
jgi:hypothetical protein